MVINPRQLSCSVVVYKRVLAYLNKKMTFENFVNSSSVIYVFGLVGVILCFCAKSIMELRSDSDLAMLVYDENVSTIYSSMKSMAYSNSVYLCIDTMTSGNLKNQDRAFVQRGLIISSLLVPDMAILFFLIPAHRADAFGCVAAARTITYTVAALTYLRNFGGSIFESKLFTLLAAVATCNTVLRSVDSLGSSTSIFISLLITYIIFIILLVYYSFIWLKSIGRVIETKEISEGDIGCTVYLGCITSMTIVFALFRFAFGIIIDPDASATTLIAHRGLLAVFLVIISVMHSRNHKSNMLRTQIALERKRIFVRMFAHEIRTPMNIVVTGLRLVEKELQKLQDGHYLLEMINDTKMASEIAVTLLDDILAYEKIEAGIIVLEIVDVPAFEFIQESVRPFMIQAKQLGVNLSIHEEVQLFNTLDTYTLRVDRNKLNQVIRNLISNALKFTPNGGSVTVSATVIDDGGGSPSHRSSMSYLKIDVKDTGYGISKENVGRLFKEIVQFHAGKLQNGGGSGLGLWLSKNIVNLHQGKIYGYSEGEGFGCTFSIEIPVIHCANTSSSGSYNHNSFSIRQTYAKKSKVFSGIDSSGELIQKESLHRDKTRAAIYAVNKKPPIEREKSKFMLEEEPAVVHKEISVRSCRGTHSPVEVLADFSSSDEKTDENSVVLSVLMVDDSTMGRKMLRRAVVDKFDQIYEAEHGLAAVDLVRQLLESGKPPDVILIDQHMPIMDGPTAVRHIRAIGFKGLIIGVTGNSHPEDVRTFFDHGAEKVFTKPFDFDTFDELVAGGKQPFE